MVFQNERVSTYLDEATRRPLIAQLQQQLVKEHVDPILEKGTTSFPELS
jgi:hypothetical protein